MNGIFYLKLAVQNIRKNARTYVPYILTCTGSVMMFDILLTLASNEQIAQMNGGSDSWMLHHHAVYRGIPVLYKQLSDETAEDGDWAV